MAIALVATAAALAGAIIGVVLEGTGRGTRVIVPFAGGLLMGISLFGVLPEVVSGAGWAVGPLLFAGGYGVLRWDPLESTCRHASLSIL